MTTGVLLVVAKAPVAGFAKTRLAATIGETRAAEVAAASLLDTVDTVLAVPDTVPVVALTGDLTAAQRGEELAELLARCTVIPQRGDDLDDRLANAHADVAREFPGRPVFQVGMDTPQLRPQMLTGALVRLDGPNAPDAVLGPATDGGWWGLGLRVPSDGAALRGVPMSRSDTGTRTLFALRGNGLRVDKLATLSDVDTLTDAVRVAAAVPDGRFGRTVAGLDHWLARRLAS